MKKEKIIEKINKPDYKGFLFFVVITFVLHRCCTESCNATAGMLQTGIVSEFFHEATYEASLAKYSWFINLSNILTLLVVFYKSLADKIGRKPILATNVLGMTISCLLCYFSTSFWMWYLGKIMLLFFAQTGLHSVYFSETVKNGKASKYFAYTKALGLIAASFLPLVRGIWLDNDISLWRKAYLFPAIICGITFIITLFALKETKPFLKNKLEIIEGKEITKEKEKIDLTSGLKYAFKNKQILLMLVMFMVMYIAGLAVEAYVESMMVSVGISNANITIELFVYSLTYAFVSFGCGFLSNRISNKKMVTILIIVAIVCCFTFYGSCYLNFSPYLIGIFQGFCMGSVWMASDYLKHLMIDYCPIDYRSSIISIAEFSTTISHLISTTISIFLIPRIGIAPCGMLIFIPSMLLVFELLVKIKKI